MPENWLANAAITDMQMRQRDVVALMQNTRLADAKVENDALRDDVAGRRRLHIKAVCRQCVKLPPPPVRIMPPRLADTAERIISPL